MEYEYKTLKGLTVRAMAAAAEGSFVGDEAVLDTEVTSAVIDSRKAVRGSVFFAIRGENTDGYNFIPSAAEKGALCCVCERAYDGYNCIVVNDVVKALQDIARAYRTMLNITIVGITGSVGKTTTKEVVASVLSQRYKVVKTEGNYNNGLGVPLTILSIHSDAEVAVVEMGINHYGEMRLLSSITRPTMCIMTNIGISHIENFGSRENIFEAKSEIFEYMPPTARCILNGDDDLLRTAQRNNVCFYGFGKDNDVNIESFCEHGFDGTDFTVNLFGEQLECRVSVPGRHILFAAMAAMAAGSWLGISKDQLVDGVAAAKTISGRVNVIRTEKYTVIDDCYNAAPQSMESGIDLLTKCDAKRTVCILGDMGELGGEAPLLHRHVGEHAAKCGVGLLVAIGSLSENMYSGCLQNGGNCLYFKTKEEFLERLEGVLLPGDVILVKASHFMDFPKIVEALIK